MLAKSVTSCLAEFIKKPASKQIDKELQMQKEISNYAQALVNKTPAMSLKKT